MDFRPHAIHGISQRDLWTRSALIPGGCDAFFKPLQAIAKSDLSTYVLYLIVYLMSYVLFLMSHLMTYAICSHGFGLCLAFGTKTCDFVTRVDALCLVSTCHFLRILIPFEEPLPYTHRPIRPSLHTSMCAHVCMPVYTWMHTCTRAHHTRGCTYA